MANNTTGFTRIIKAAGYSWKGFRAAWTHEAAFRQESLAVLLGRHYRLLAGCGCDYPCVY
ncbi:diacylglycerol kinase [Salmonella enterica subsp. arizonae]|uniref:Diacylglycerol kinase n=1 Tax=Salmonella enterica subsp. arizonae TaxID=59203 RepID=A0A379TJ63_SALER|nr:diacylglycerol kinase [Salmonella enterica subsp. arizonae]